MFRELGAQHLFPGILPFQQIGLQHLGHVFHNLVGNALGVIYITGAAAPVIV